MKIQNVNRMCVCECKKCMRIDWIIDLPTIFLEAKMLRVLRRFKVEVKQKEKQRSLTAVQNRMFARFETFLISDEYFFFVEKRKTNRAKNLTSFLY